MTNPRTTSILVISILWLFLTSVLFSIAPRLLKFSDRFVYRESPTASPQFLFSRANFDGINYLSIAQSGYKSNEQGFFPLYPLAIRVIGSIIGHELVVAVLLSLICLVLSIYFLQKLPEKDFSPSTKTVGAVLLLIFPTSFFFQAAYTESLFLLLSVLAFYFARNGKWLPASAAVALAATTRPMGIILAVALVVEWISQKQEEKRPDPKPLLVLPLGILAYMIYQWGVVRFGATQSLQIILPYQVAYRYFRMLLTFNLKDFVYFRVTLEALSAAVFFLIAVFGYLKKVRLSYLVYLVLGIIVPSLTGTLVSEPRFLLVLFPGFLILARALSGRPVLKYLYVAVSLIGLVLANILFAAGYWVA